MLTHIGTETIETERLLLRRFRYSDDDAMLRSEYEENFKKS